MPKKDVDLYFGDFFANARRVRSSSVDLVFADPPYFLSNGGMTVASGKQVSVDKGKWDKEPDPAAREEFHNKWIAEAYRVLKPSGSVVISGTYHSIFQTATLLESSGFKILNDIVWFKPNGAPNLSRRRLTASHETLIWACKTTSTNHTFNYEALKYGHFPGDQIKRPGKQMRSVWWIPNTPRSEKKLGGHPTQKPLELMRRVVLAFSNAGDRVLDPFMGSGSTGAAAVELGRRFVGFEQEKEFFELAQKRIEGAQIDKRRQRRSQHKSNWSEV